MASLPKLLKEKIVENEILIKSKFGIVFYDKLMSGDFCAIDVLTVKKLIQDND